MKKGKVREALGAPKFLIVAECAGLGMNVQIPAYTDAQARRILLLVRSIHRGEIERRHPSPPKRPRRPWGWSARSRQSLIEKQWAEHQEKVKALKLTVEVRHIEARSASPFTGIIKGEGHETRAAQ